MSRVTRPREYDVVLSAPMASSDGRLSGRACFSAWRGDAAGGDERGEEGDAGGGEGQQRGSGVDQCCPPERGAEQYPGVHGGVVPGDQRGAGGGVARDETSLLGGEERVGHK